MKNPNIFYGTFMQRQAFKNNFVTLIAKNRELARQAMFEHFGDKFFTVYSTDEFVDVPEQYGLTPLCEIRVVDDGSSIQYFLL